MFLVTNRVVHPKKDGFAKFGSKPSPRGPREIRMAEVTGSPGNWSVAILPDTLSRAHKVELGLPVSKRAWASQLVAHRIRERVMASKGHRHLLVYVHGYNNSVQDVVDRAHQLEQAYDVEVQVFTWPANGGGLSGAASYLSDKADALVSVGALDRCFAKIKQYLYGFWADNTERITREARDQHPDNGELQRIQIARRSEQFCPLKIDLVVHSMGNYILKHLLRSTTYPGIHGLFDNVVMVAADTNAEDHATWVDQIVCRNRVFIAINEDDYALRVARLKTGERQKRRLGHSTTGLDSKQALYVDFTEMPGVGASHSYFVGDPVSDRSGLPYRFFYEALRGDRAEKLDGLVYDARRNLLHPG